MELLLIIVGTILSTAIIYMMLEWIFGRVVDYDVNPFDGDRLENQDAHSGRESHEKH